MLKKLLTAFLSGSMLLSGIGLPVLANEHNYSMNEEEQDPFEEEMFLETSSPDVQKDEDGKLVYAIKFMEIKEK